MGIPSRVQVGIPSRVLAAIAAHLDAPSTPSAGAAKNVRLRRDPKCIDFSAPITLTIKPTIHLTITLTIHLTIHLTRVAIRNLECGKRAVGTFASFPDCSCQGALLHAPQLAVGRDGIEAVLQVERKVCEHAHVMWWTMPGVHHGALGFRG